MEGDQRPTILGLSIAFPILSILAVLLRFKARTITRAKLGADDWTIAAALVGYSVLSCSSIVLMKFLIGPYHKCRYYCVSW